MKTRIRAPVAVVGAGIAGVVAAHELRRLGIPVRLYEAGKRIAGLAATFTDAEGFTHDFGAHFVTNRLADAIGVGGKCRDVAHYGEAILLGGKVYSYPLGMLGNPRFLLSGIASRFRRQRHDASNSAAAWFRSEYGSALAESVAIPLVEAWSGARAEDLAASVGSEKLQHGVVASLYLKLAGVVTGRAVANGYSHEMPESPSVWHVYPDGGVSTLVQHLASDIQDCIRLESPVEAIVIDSGRTVAIRVGGCEEEVSAVVSTAPCNILPRLIVGTDSLQHLARFRFRPMVFVNLRLQGRGLIPDTVLWTPETAFPFFRVTETTRSMPWLAPAGKSTLTVDFGCQVGDHIWSSPDDQLTQLSLEHLAPIVRDVRKRFLGSQVLRTPIAYPVFLREYEPDRKRLQRSTGIDGLYSIGRNGEFAHILMEDVYWRTLARVRQLVQDLEA